MKTEDFRKLLKLTSPIISKLHPVIRLELARRLKHKGLVTLFDPNSIRSYSRVSLKPTFKTIKINDGLTFFVDINDIIGFRTALEGKWDTTATEIIQLFNARDTLYLDIGANIGITSIPVAKLGYPTCAFEPNPLALEILFKNLAENPSDNFTVIPLALGKMKDVSTFRSLYVPLGNLGAASLNEKWSPGRNSPIRFGVKQTCIDAAIPFCFSPKELSRFKQVVIKVDVEGSEIEVLEGGRNFIREKRPVIIFENNPKQNDGSDPTQFWKSLKGYSLHGISAKNFKPFNPSNRYENVVAIPNELLSNFTKEFEFKDD